MPVLKVKLDEVRVLDESNELSDSDEPYFIIFALGRTAPDNKWHLKTTAYGWNDADAGDLLQTLTRDEVVPELQPLLEHLFSEYCWGPGGKPANVAHADDLIILVGAMELDFGTVGEARDVADLFMTFAGGDLDRPRSEVVASLKHDMKHALGVASHKRAGFDNQVGKVTEVRFTEADFKKAASGKVRRTITIDGGDSEGAYRLGFDLSKG